MREVIIARRAHIPAIAELEKQTFKHPWSENSLQMFFEGEGAYCVACMENGDLVSYCTVTTVLDEAQIINVASAPKHKNKGCAKATIELVLDEAKRRNISSVSLEVRESNVPAISLYESFGFSVAGKRKDFYTEPRENALVMIKNLD